jgi:hypothetical protein
MGLAIPGGSALGGYDQRLKDALARAERKLFELLACRLHP